MLPARHRLKKQYQFRYVYAKGASAGGKMFTLVYCKSKRRDGLAVGFSVSNKVGKATLRNRVKRLLRESVRACMNDISRGYNLIIVAKNGADFRGLTYSDTLHEVKALLTRAGLFRVEA